MRTLPFRAFTLLEMLMSIAVIVILLTLLSNGFLVIRQKMEAAKCVSNLRQIGVALMTHAAEFDGKIPARYNPNESEYSNRYWPLRLVNLGYVNNTDIFYCPSFFPKNNKEATKPVAQGAAQTYGMRDWILPGLSPTAGGIRVHKPLMAIKNPSDFFLVVDSYWAAAGWHSQGYGVSAYPGGTGDNRIHIRHNGKANALFADGSVRAMPPEYFSTLQSPDHQPAPQDMYFPVPNSQFPVETDPNPPR